MREITSDLLKAVGGRPEQIALWIERGGDQNPLTLDFCLSLTRRFDFGLVTGSLVSRRARARSRYDFLKKIAWEKYQAAEGPAREKLCHGDSAKARNAYERVRRAAVMEYQRACASAFFHAWTSPANQKEQVAA
ncbi:MAG: hypothetical protein WDM89_08275 [Rhizomicrobium sp.]